MASRSRSRAKTKTANPENAELESALQSAIGENEAPPAPEEAEAPEVEASASGGSEPPVPPAPPEPPKQEKPEPPQDTREHYRIENRSKNVMHLAGFKDIDGKPLLLGIPADEGIVNAHQPSAIISGRTYRAMMLHPVYKVLAMPSAKSPLRIYPTIAR